MGISKAQKNRQEKVCQCGCGEVFYPFPVYKKGGGGLVTPDYKRGHNPKNKVNQFGEKPAWNKGLAKGDHPSIERMGFQPGHQPYNDWSHVVEKQCNDPEYRERWLDSKKGQVPWNKGKKKAEYINGIKSGPEHGNWCGGKRGLYDTAELKTFAKTILQRDNYTCQQCGDRNHKGRGRRCGLEVHHIVAIAEDHTLALDPDNAVTLCASCHRLTDNFGTKLVHKRRKAGR